MTTPLEIEILSPLKLPTSEASVYEQCIAEAAQELSAIGVTLPQPHFMREPGPRSVYERVKCNDFIFVFKYDDYRSDMLHIYSRHMTTTDDAIGLFLSQDSVWDEERKRFANFSETHGLYWFWRNEQKKVVMVISCFKRQPQRSGGDQPSSHGATVPKHPLPSEGNGSISLPSSKNTKDEKK